MTHHYCKQCLTKQQQINALQEQVSLLKAKLRYQERTAAEGPFTSSTPSSKIPLKKNSDPKHKTRRGGAKHGHKGHGRNSFNIEQADHTKRIPAPDICPDCGKPLKSKGIRSRTVLECKPVQVENIVYQLERKVCSGCKKNVQAHPPGVLPKSKYANSFLAHVAIEHYVHGVTLGRLAEQTGAGIGSLIGAMHILGRLMKSTSDKLAEQYRKAPVKHADETGWRNDGQNGYSWLFCTEEISVFRFRKTRSSAVPREVLGEKKLPGVLVVDRYGGYNKVPCEIQYCYAHLLRHVEDLEKDFPEDKEVAAFVKSFKPLLSSAMSLRGLGLSHREFVLRAKQIKRKMLRVVNHSASHPGIQKIQDIFREKRKRLYHWARGPDIPADNNLAERELRPVVIARKVSFGSQSEEGAKTREILMTVLRSLKKATADPHAVLTMCLDRLAIEPDTVPFDLLFPKPAHN